MFSLAASRSVHVSSAVLWTAGGIVLGALAGGLLGWFAVARRQESTQSRATASKIAAGVAAVFFVVVLILLLAKGFGAENSSSTKTTHVSVYPSQDIRHPGVIVKHTDTTETTTPGADTSLLGRAFSSGAAPVIFQVFLAGLAAFAAGAIVQRIWLGEYAITVGPITVPALSPVSAPAAEKAVDLITKSPEFSEVISPGGVRPPAPQPQFVSIQDDDHLAMLSIRIELEQRIRELARAVGLDKDIPLKKLPGRLAEKGILNNEAAQGLNELIELGDRVAKGAKVEPEAVRKLRDGAIDVLYGLSALTSRAREGPL